MAKTKRTTTTRRPGFTDAYSSLENVLMQREAELYALSNQRQQDSELAAKNYEQYHRDLKNTGVNKRRADELHHNYQNLFQESAREEEVFRGALEQEKKNFMWPKDGAVDEDGLLAAMMEEQRLMDSRLRANQGDSRGRRPRVVSESQPRIGNKHAPSISFSNTTAPEKNLSQGQTAFRINDGWMDPPRASAESTAFPANDQRSFGGFSQTRPLENNVDGWMSNVNYSHSRPPEPISYFGGEPLYDESWDGSDTEFAEEQYENDASWLPDSVASAQRFLSSQSWTSPAPLGSRRSNFVDVPINLHGPQEIWIPSPEDPTLHNSSLKSKINKRITSSGEKSKSVESKDTSNLKSEQEEKGIGSIQPENNFEGALSLVTGEAAGKERTIREAERMQEEMDKRRQEIQDRKQQERLARAEKMEREERARKQEEALKADLQFEARLKEGTRNWTTVARPAITDASFSAFPSTLSTYPTKVSSSLAMQRSASSGSDSIAYWNPSSHLQAKPIKATVSLGTGLDLMAPVFTGTTKKSEIEEKGQKHRLHFEDPKGREEALAKWEADRKRREAERMQQEMDKRREQIQERQRLARLAQSEKTRRDEA